MIMRNTATRLILWIAEILDRNLLTLPDVDPYDNRDRGHGAVPGPPARNWMNDPRF